MKKVMILLLIVVLPLAVAAKEKQHAKTALDQDCSECHGAQAQAWQNGKHGLMNVSCAVCHGSTEKNFVAKPDMERCAGCHGEIVREVQKRLPPKARSCYLCHDPHAVTLRFHAKEGR